MAERLLVCGGRDFNDQAFVFGVLDMLSEELVINAVIQGDCQTGADRLARMWAISRNHHLDRFPADWRGYGKAAGPIRNQRVINEGRPTIGVVLPGGRGTNDMARKLQAVVWCIFMADIPLRIVSCSSWLPGAACRGWNTSAIAATIHPASILLICLSERRAKMSKI